MESSLKHTQRELKTLKKETSPHKQLGIDNVSPKKNVIVDCMRDSNASLKTTIVSQEIEFKLKQAKE